MLCHWCSERSIWPARLRGRCRFEQPYIVDYSGYEPFHQASDAVVDAYNATLRQAALRHPSTSVVAIEGWQVGTMVLGGRRAPQRRRASASRARGRPSKLRTGLQSRWLTDQKAAPSRAAIALRSAGRTSGETRIETRSRTRPRRTAGSTMSHEPAIEPPMTTMLASNRWTRGASVVPSPKKACAKTALARSSPAGYVRR